MIKWQIALYDVQCSLIRVFFTIHVECIVCTLYTTMLQKIMVEPTMTDSTIN